MKASDIIWEEVMIKFARIADLEDEITELLGRFRRTNPKTLTQGKWTLEDSLSEVAAEAHERRIEQYELTMYVNGIRFALQAMAGKLSEKEDVSVDIFEDLENLLRLVQGEDENEY